MTKVTYEFDMEKDASDLEVYNNAFLANSCLCEINGLISSEIKNMDRNKVTGYLESVLEAILDMSDKFIRLEDD